MKAKAMMLALGMMAVAATPMHAQFASNASSTGSTSTKLVEISHPSSFKTFTIGYDADILTGATLNGFALQYTYAGSISKSLPMYVEAGLRLNFGYKSFPLYYEESSITKMALAIPVNFTWRYAINDNLTLIPYTGFHFKFNLLCLLSVDGESISCFDKDEFDDYTWSRFQAGWQIGSRFAFNKFMIGLEYGIDFNKLAEGMSSSEFMLSLGFVF